MARRRSFVPQSPDGSSLEGRLAPSTFGNIGDWFSSQYRHVKEDLGISHKKNHDAAAGIQYLWNNSKALSKPVPASSPAAHHVVLHAAKVK